MRCEDVIRELATPTNTQDAVALAEHLRRCTSCATLADRAARLDCLWKATHPAEPPPEVWENLWSQVVCSLDSSTFQEVASTVRPAFRNGSAGSSVPKFQVNSPAPALATSFRSRLWTAIGIVGLSQAAAILFIAGLTWTFFISSKHEVASLNRSTSNSTKPASVADALPSVDIEEGHLVVILANPKSPSVVDRTPKAMDIDQASLVDWYGDERYFDWPQVFNEAESFAKTKVAMTE